MSENADGYISSGSNSETCLRESEAMYKAVKIHPRILRDVSSISLGTSILGHQVSMPFGIAPSAMHCLGHPLGEKNSIRAAKSYNTCYCLSTLSTTSIKDVANASPDAFRIFQLYITKNREITKKMV